VRIFLSEGLKKTPSFILLDVFIFLHISDFTINTTDNSNAAGVSKPRFIQRILNMKIPSVSGDLPYSNVKSFSINDNT
jgi:hypothetical protein